jgi:hypothetical protein
LVIEERGMKKTGLVFLLLLGAVLLGAEGARIEQVTGTVEVKTPGTSAWRAAQAGQVLDSASLISTGFKSTALVRIGNSVITVRALTRLSLEEIAAAQEEERVTVYLQTGRIRAEVKPPSGGKTDFTVRSPTVTASVRGTAFEFDGIRVEVAEGRVYLGGGGTAGVYVSEGHGVTAETGRAVTVIEAVKEELTPALPAGTDTEPAVIRPGPSDANLDVLFDWSGQ